MSDHDQQVADNRPAPIRPIEEIHRSLRAKGIDPDDECFDGPEHGVPAGKPLPRGARLPGAITAGHLDHASAPSHSPVSGDSPEMPRKRRAQPKPL